MSTLARPPSARAGPRCGHAPRGPARALGGRAGHAAGAAKRRRMRRQAAAASRPSLAELRERWLARADDRRDDGAHDLAAVLMEAVEELEDARPPALPADRLWNEV